MFSTGFYYVKIEPDNARAILDRLEQRRVIPLIAAMSKNTFSFISEKANGDEIAAVTSQQIVELRKIIYEGLTPFHKAQLTKDVQERIFGICKSLLPLALSFGYVEEAAGLVKVMRHPSLVGERAQWNPEEAFKVISATYGKRKQNGDTDRIKYSNRLFIDDIIKGKYGKVDKTPAEVIETLKFCYKNPDKILSENRGKIASGDKYLV